TDNRSPGGFHSLPLCPFVACPARHELGSDNLCNAHDPACRDGLHSTWLACTYCRGQLLWQLTKGSLLSGLINSPPKQERNHGHWPCVLTHWLTLSQILLLWLATEPRSDLNLSPRKR